ncbi:hypothetical protein DWZ67_02105 [Bacteroides sp. AF34-31BH]|uniref:hypothetical protein n=1 Tax=Bacteroides sp. AF34-31BH TaxID=2292931 RepID=UPI000E772AE3|nr:hypothetical protein [Bacteroides sp. AF34-31BH]RJV08713.1 hypothetical protein DWZ67_02105 [Bacteroides sp. AF34-31BH]
MDYLSGIKNDYFEYKELYSNFGEKIIETRINDLRPPFTEIAKVFDIKSNTQWIIRTYLASKMILASSVLLTSAQYAKSKNLRIVEPYLLYYPLLSCARSVIFTNPHIGWSDDLVTMTHSKTINLIGDIVAKYNKKKGDEIKKLIDWAREYREIFSYKFPANGLTGHLINFEDVVIVCRLLCEIAQLQSAILEAAIAKHVTQHYPIDEMEIIRTYVYGEKNFQFIDSEDGYRLNYIQRKVARPLSIINTMTEGMVEDFFGAWCIDTNENDIYNPDENWRIIFPVP